MESQTKQPKNNPTPDKILVLGIGNLVLNDEGIGIHVVNALSEMEIPQGVDVLDGGLPIMYPVTHSATIAVALTQWNMRTGSSHT